MLDQIGTAPSIFPNKYVHSKWNSVDVMSTALNSDAVVEKLVSIIVRLMCNYATHVTRNLICGH